jgi:2-succinyl-6-hydroxy-2,4-cyclohexadiene-1-carboxylate synthase
MHRRVREGRVIVYLHGFTGSPRSWDEVGLPGLAEPLLGHAPSLVRTGTFGDEIARLQMLIAPRAPVHIVGYSLGARMALGLVAAAPRLFSRATLIGVHPGLREADERAERIAADERWARMLEIEGIEPFVHAWEAQPLFATQSAEQRGRRRRQRLAHDPVGLAAALRGLGLGHMPDLWPALSALSLPVTYVAGEHDPKFRALAMRAAALTPRASVSIVAGAGHDVVLEQPRAVAAALLEEPT